ncbi:MAG TPA: PQQ-dependent sugar dehydrogenase [Acidimicrobiales bacterium]
MRRTWGVVALVVATLAVACEPAVPEGFHEYVVFDRLRQPTAVAFAPDGQVFVAEKRGVVLRYDGVGDDAPTVLADLRTNTHNFWDRGLLDVQVAPDFLDDPAVYVLYTYDAPPGGTAPRWGSPGVDDDGCPTPPGPNDDGCVVTARLSRLPLADDHRTWTGEEQVLLHDWCQQYPSHSIGTMAFAPDGALYVGGGDGASFTFDDYGQRGTPRNPCGDPPGGVGAVLQPPSAQGGSLRSQDLRTGGDPVTLDGTIVRVDPDTGAALPDNPLASHPDPNARRIVAYGLRNPFRFALVPGTDDLWIGDVGSGIWEEINFSRGDDPVVDNFGWPCYEGNIRRPSYDQIDLAVCETLYTFGPLAVRAPVYSYRHRVEVTPDEPCTEQNGSSISGIAIAPDDSSYPDGYDGALFFADATRGCIWVMRAGDDGLPDPGRIERFVTPASAPVDLAFGPDGALWYVDLQGGRIVRVGYSSTNHPPVARVTATPTRGDPPLTVTFDASGSTDPDPGDVVSYAWELDDDGEFDDGTDPTATATFTTDRLAVVRVRVTDLAGSQSLGVALVEVGDPSNPVAVVSRPEPGRVAEVGEQVAFEGTGLGPDGRELPASALSWTADLLHCPDRCHHHPGVFSLVGARSGTLTMPDHEFPAALELTLTVRTPDGRTASTTTRVEYRSTRLTLASSPAGVPLTGGGTTKPAPFEQLYATNGRITLSAPATVTIGGVPHAFVGWSDGGARSHEITVPTPPTTLTATYAPVTAPAPAASSTAPAPAAPSTAPTTTTTPATTTSTAAPG